MSTFLSAKAIKKPNVTEAIDFAKVYMETTPERQHLVNDVLEQYQLEEDGYHGPRHWERVWVNGLLLLQAIPTYVDADTLFLFALFHDSQRTHEGACFNHGPNAADFMLEQSMFDRLCQLFSEKSVVKAARASRYHTSSIFEKEPEVAACLDADRLDLNRVGIYPDIKRLHYQNVIDKMMIYEAAMRSQTSLPIALITRKHSL